MPRLQGSLWPVSVEEIAKRGIAARQVLQLAQRARLGLTHGLARDPVAMPDVLQGVLFTVAESVGPGTPLNPQFNESHQFKSLSAGGSQLPAIPLVETKSKMINNKNAFFIFPLLFSL